MVVGKFRNDPYYQGFLDGIKEKKKWEEEVKIKEQIISISYNIPTCPKCGEINGIHKFGCVYGRWQGGVDNGH